MAAEYSWIKMDGSESRGDPLGAPARKHCWVRLPIKGTDRPPHFLLFRKLTIDNSDLEHPGFLRQGLRVSPQGLVGSEHHFDHC